HIPTSNVLQTIGQHVLLDGFKVVVDLEKSRGSYLYDAASNRRLIDLYGFFGSMPVGFNHPYFANVAVQRDLLRAAKVKVANSDRRKTDLFAKFDWPRVSCPHINFALPESEQERDVIDREKKSEGEIRKLIDERKIDICAIIIEPIQGEGGDNHFRGEWLQTL